MSICRLYLVDFQTPTTTDFDVVVKVQKHLVKHALYLQTSRINVCLKNYLTNYKKYSLQHWYLHISNVCKQKNLWEKSHTTFRILSD